MAVKGESWFGLRRKADFPGYYNMYHGVHSSGLQTGCGFVYGRNSWTVRTLSSTESLRPKSWFDAELIWRFLSRRQCTDRWMDGLMDRWIDSCKHIYVGVGGWRAEREETRKRAREEHWFPRWVKGQQPPGKAVTLQERPTSWVLPLPWLLYRDIHV